MSKSMSKNELFNEVSKFYSGILTEEKALKLYELEYGDKVTIKENRDRFGERNFSEYPWFVNANSLNFMKDLQESGVVNMFASVPNIMSGLGLDRKDARELLNVYIKDYDKIYYPENLI